MPKKVERALKKAGRAKGYTGERLDQFVYGILRKKYGWKPDREKKSRKSKGKRKTSRANQVAKPGS